MGKLQMTVLGRATRDAEVKKSQAGKDYATFSLAVNFPGKDDKEDEVVFTECVLFGEGNTKAAGNWIKKGEHVWVAGRPEAEAYISKDGEAKSVLKLIVDEWEVIRSSKAKA